MPVKAGIHVKRNSCLSGKCEINMKRKLHLSVLLFFGLWVGACAGWQGNEKWQISQSPGKGIIVRKGDKVIFTNLYASYKLGDRLVKSSDYAVQKIQKAIPGDSANVTIIRIIYRDENLPGLTQSFYLHGNRDFILTEFSIESEMELATNYMAPACSDSMLALPGTDDNRTLFIPFDNDKWIRFQSYPASVEKLTSYEVTAVFNTESRIGLVVGSVEHDNWKTAIDVTGSADRPNLKSLICYGGAAGEITRDVKPHGALKGKSVKSPKVFIGLFDDWREGMEAYADVNAVIAPPKAWNKAVPFGWNSWGVVQFNLTCEKAVEVSDFFRDNLQNNHFINGDSLVYIGLDSGWNSFSEEQLKSFVAHCRENEQVAGVYWTPFTDWSKNPEKAIKDMPEYKFKDVYLYANGQPQELDGAYAIDPTHPAIEEQMKKTADLFHRCGFEYVKMDFMTHGALEADKWYDPKITTGIQAYNYGMQLLNKYFGDMFINLSISPVFPAQYAQSRRIACDAWNKIKDTEYTLNAVSYGWWIDRVYQFNDADHVVLQQATEGENRARVTSAIITGLVIAGDDFSKGGSEEGREKARKFLTNSEVNAVAQGHSFRPVEGNGEKSENQFIYTDRSGDLYYAVFNYSERDTTIRIPFDRLGLEDREHVVAKELWSGEKLDVNTPLVIPGKDVKFINFAEKPD